MKLGLIRFVLLFCLFLPGYSFAQYANDWIKQGQSYYRIPIAKQGVYRLTYDELQNAGVPVNSIDPRRIQIFHRGIEQSIFVQGQSDTFFDATDYIEFYGQANDGTLDKVLYRPGAPQPHNYYNLYSDTTAYFLTWNFGTAAGKRIEVFDEVNVSNIPKEQFHEGERLEIYKNQYSLGFAQYIGFGSNRTPVQYTHFDQGEGWTGTALQPGEAIEYQIDAITDRVEVSVLPQLEILLVGRDEDTHGVEVFVGPNSGSLRSLGLNSFVNFEIKKLNLPLQWSDISTEGKLLIRLVASPTASGNRLQFSTSYIKVSFPQSFQSALLTEKAFTLNSNAAGKSYVEFENAPAGMRVWDITNADQITSIVTRTVASNQGAVVANTANPRTLFAFTNTTRASLKKVSFRSIDPQQADFIIISNRLLMKPTGVYTDPVTAYAAYRASADGGGYDTLVLPVDILYNQFNYGETSPVAIYEFMRFMVEKGEPKYLFLVGKGRDVSSGYHRLTNPGPSVMKDLVPSAGIPASDMNFTVGLKGSLYEPAIPTGRLTATSPAEVAAYLNKVKELESTNAEMRWQKKGLHLSGGILEGELPLFRYYLDGFKEIGEGNLWGSSISTIAKREPSQVELINISDKINEGVNLVTFFGHSSSSTIDIDIGYVTDPILGYDNQGKYPVFLINGCNAGSFFLNGEVFGEDWINASDKGARNFIAHSSFALDFRLRKYSELFYKIGFTDSVFVKKGIGDVQKQVAITYMNDITPNIQDITQVQQMMLLGDPSLKLFSATKPDYQITNSDIDLVSFNDKQVTALTDSFALKLVVRNLGLAKPRPLKISVFRTLANGTTLVYDSIFNPVLYIDTLLFKIKKGSEQGGGNNVFRIVIDSDNSIEELNEQNNEATLTRFIATNSTLNLSPAKYAIVNNSSVKLLWQDSNPFSQEREYQVEIDTALSFSSAFVKKEIVTGKVLATLNFNLLEKDSAVYYWRTRFNNPNESESQEWQTSSFSFIKNGNEGWAQLSKDQLKENFFSGIVDEGEGKPFRFEAQSTAVSITTFGNTHPNAYTEVSVKINDAEYNLSTQGQPCRNNTINLVAFNKSTAVPYAAIPFVFQDPRSCGREPQLINSFQINELETALLDDFIETINRVGVSDSVVLFSIGDAGYNLWSDAVKIKLGELGVGLSEINTFQPGEPIIIFGRKGASPGTAKIVRATLAPASGQLISESSTITGRATEGLMKSVLIGPSDKWIQLQIKSPELELSDTVSFKIYGVSVYGVETLITDQATSSYDLSPISAAEFPYLRIEYHVEDEINLTPADWKNWLVLYEPAAEGILFYDEKQLTKSFQEGEIWSSRFGFANISDKSFTTQLPYELEIYTNSTQQRTIKSGFIDPPAVGDTTFFNVTDLTIGKVGINNVSVFVNKRVLPEQIYDNNVVSLLNHLNVTEDNIPPVLEVTFDGRTLRNGEYVSSNPQISISVKDENPFLQITDTTTVNIYFGTWEGDDCNCKRIPFSSKEVKWVPATSANDYKVDFNPANLLDGSYGLIAEAADVSGNQSGPQPYEITFNVKNETSLNFKGVYPNPSAIGFFFKYELTGNSLPEKLLLEIFSSTGQLVTQFNEEEAAGFYIGSNEVIWDGTDATGKTLANGIYLYRFTIQVNGLERSDTGKLILNR